MNENRLPTHRPVTIRDVTPTSIYDVVPASGHAAINNARVAALMNRMTRRTNAIVQRMDDTIDAMEERKREHRRRRGR